jgi:TRAP-type mannitol/chloroaromatic compound transport system permease small subunit
VSWLNLVLILLIVADVIIRKVTGYTSTWISEIQWYLFAMVFLWGGSYALLHKKHVSVDLYYHRMNNKDKSLVDFVGHLTLLLPWTMAIVYTGFMYFHQSWSINESSPDPGGLPYRWLIKLMIPGAFLLMLIQACSELLKAFRQYRSPLPES